MDVNAIKAIVEVFENSNISKMDMRDGSLHITLEKNGTVVVNNHLQQTGSLAPAKEVINETGYEVKSPLVGTFYSRSAPDQHTFVSVGDFVKKGDPLCIIEAMKVMNEIPAPMDGKVIEILKADGDIVEYDTPLMRIEEMA